MTAKPSVARRVVESRPARSTKVGAALREARMHRGLRQGDVAGVALVSHQMVSAAEAGRKRLMPDCLRRATEHLDHPRLHIEAACEITGGACTPWLDGERVDLHRSSVRAKALEELMEAVRAVEALDITNRGEPENLGDVIQQVIDAEGAAKKLVAILCLEFGRSARAEYRKHQQKLRRRGYLRCPRPA